MVTTGIFASSSVVNIPHYVLITRIIVLSSCNCPLLEWPAPVSCLSILFYILSVELTCSRDGTVSGTKPLNSFFIIFLENRHS